MGRGTRLPRCTEGGCPWWEAAGLGRRAAHCTVEVPHPRQAGYPGRAQSSLGRHHPEPCSKPCTNMGPVTSLALRPLLATGTRRTRSTRSLCHTQPGKGRRKRLGLFGSTPTVDCSRVPSPTWDPSLGSETFPLLGAREEGGGGAASPLRGNPARASRNWRCS